MAGQAGGWHALLSAPCARTSSVSRSPSPLAAPPCRLRALCLGRRRRALCLRHVSTRWVGFGRCRALCPSLPHPSRSPRHPRPPCRSLDSHHTPTTAPSAPTADASAPATTPDATVATPDPAGVPAECASWLHGDKWTGDEVECHVCNRQVEFKVRPQRRRQGGGAPGLRSGGARPLCCVPRATHDAPLPPASPLLRPAVPAEHRP